MTGFFNIYFDYFVFCVSVLHEDKIFCFCGLFIFCILVIFSFLNHEGGPCLGQILDGSGKNLLNLAPLCSHIQMLPFYVYFSLSECHLICLNLCHLNVDIFAFAHYYTHLVVFRFCVIAASPLSIYDSSLPFCPPLLLSITPTIQVPSR